MATADRERIDLRVDAKQKETLKKAAELSGSSLSKYMVTAAVADAEKIIEDHSMTLENDIFDQFVAACDNAAPPNQALKDALEFTKESGY